MYHILIVEADAAIASVYKNSLEQAGYAVHIAGDGQAALNYIQGAAPDGVLLSLKIPNVNGIEFLKYIRACHHLAQIPIFVYANALVPALINEATEAGATKFFSKSTLTPCILAAAFNYSFKPR